MRVRSESRVGVSSFRGEGSPDRGVGVPGGRLTERTLNAGRQTPHHKASHIAHGNRQTRVRPPRIQPPRREASRAPRRRGWGCIGPIRDMGGGTTNTLTASFPL
jgi:hypothetical protein